MRTEQLGGDRPRDAGGVARMGTLRGEVLGVQRGAPRGAARRALRGAVLGALVAAQVAVTGCALSSAEQTEEHQATLGPGQSVKVVTRNGRVEVRAGRAAGRKVTIKAVKKARASSKPEALLKEIRVKLTQGADRLTIAAEHPDGSLAKQYGVSFEVTVPPDAPVIVETRNGAVVVKNIGAKAQAETRNGSVKISGATDEVKALTRNGSITVSGQPKRLTLESSNGAIRVNLGAATRLVGSSEARTKNGSITVEAPAGFAGRIDASTKNGRVRSEHPLGASAPSGASTFRLRTKNGSIRIRKL